MKDTDCTESREPNEGTGTLSPKLNRKNGVDAEDVRCPLTIWGPEERKVECEASRHATHYAGFTIGTPRT